MAWLFFIDESGHDHRSTPYEVHGGFAVHASQLWPFVQEMQKLEIRCFGCRLHEFGKEIKGRALLGRDPFKFAGQGSPFPGGDRRRLCRSFLDKGRRKASPNRDEFTSYGQACLRMAEGVFELLEVHGAVLMASAIPRGVVRPPNFRFDDYLRKDLVYLLERLFYFLEEEGNREHGILVMDETDKHQDRRFVAQMEAYFTRTETGRQRTERIVPNPFFVSSDMTYAVQAADLCIYCVNWGFRLPSRGMDAERREEIADMFGRKLANLQFQGRGSRGGRAFESYGVVYVPDPYGADSMP